jgi:hypothetical protein
VSKGALLDALGIQSSHTGIAYDFRASLGDFEDGRVRVLIFANSISQQELDDCFQSQKFGQGVIWHAIIPQFLG